MKKILKISLIFVLAFVVFMGTFETICNAESDYATKMGTLINGTYDDTTGTKDKVNTITGTIITSIRIIGIAVAIVMLLAVAMKYMTAAPGDKADIKKSAIQYVVGAVVLFGVVGILGIINKFSGAIK